MKFFYNLRRYEKGEYVVIALEERGFRGVGAIVPEREKGENYKTIMGAIEEYRHLVESSKPEHFAILSFRLREDFPGHPKVTFAISAAALQLFSKLSGLGLNEALMCEGLKGSVLLRSWNGELVIPEETGGIFETLSMASPDRAILYREYPRGEMREVFMVLSRYFAGYTTSNW